MKRSLCLLETLKSFFDDFKGTYNRCDEAIEGMRKEPTCVRFLKDEAWVVKDNS